MKKLYIYTLLCFFIILSSCQDILDVENKNGINQHNNYQTSTDLAINIVGIYSGIQEIMPSVILFNGLRSDEMGIDESASPQIRSIYNYMELSTNSYVDPTKFYKVIVNCNDFLKNANVFEQRRDEVSLKNYQACIGEVHRIKYWCYWMIAKIYGEVYIFDESFETDFEVQKIKDMTPFTLQEVIPELIKVLEDPSYHWDKKINWQQLVDEPKAIYNYYGIEHQVLLGDLYLWNKEYKKAANIFYKYLTIGSIGWGDLIGENEDLFGHQNYIQLYKKTIQTCGKKLIGVSEYNHKFEQYNSLYALFNRGEIIAGQGYLNIIESQKNTENSTGDLYRKFIDNENKIWKYNFEKKGFLNTLQNRIIIYKDSELYMKLIECLNEMGDSETALVLLNQGAQEYYDEDTKVFAPPFHKNNISDNGIWDEIWGMNSGIRQRVSLTPRVFPNEADDNKKQELLRQWILEENAMEFAFEGKRFEDLIRFSLREGTTNIIAQTVAMKYPESERNTIRSKLSDINNWFWPIE
ncbi:RagB/SusD family nutrient uptake outer membrane protein [Halosquirtibacter xylanolyticus]|uniref:RagB/SusD family nutrient uptake outer membrane protein n=1 Tax=Halosquirtibacter xylanolyticus TaxID=3374599 RepID=UPI0037487313|nr:RagB/SusD family nutrient uptake outer membrane protein [Prolixibacteraceae bacterium]